MGAVFQDVRYCLRTLRKNPGFTAVVVLTLALGIGANTAVFSLVDSILLRPLPFPRPEQLVRIVDHARGAGVRDIGLSLPELNDLRERAGAFADVSATWPVDANVTGAAHPERVELLAVSPNYFAMLGARPRLGRVFGPEDVVAGFADAVVISDGLWRRFFGADPQVLGRKIRADNDSYTVVGVMPPEFRHPGRTVSTEVDLWGTTGFAADPFPTPVRRSLRLLPGAIGRLKPGLTVAQAQARVDSLVAALSKAFPNEYPATAQWSVQLEPLQDAIVGNVRPLMLVLLAAVAMMLLTGCANIANLLLARASARQREIALRCALGAGRGRLVRQLLTESILLSLIAGAAGVAATWWTVSLLARLIPEKFPRLHAAALDWRVMLFALAISLATGLLFGLVPALEASSFSLADHLKQGSAGGGRRRGRRASAALVISEVALCVVLMTGAGLLVRSFWKLAHVDPGFDPRNVLAARIWLPQPNNPKGDPYATGEARVAFMREVLRRMRAVPGTVFAAITNSLPTTGDGNRFPIAVETGTAPAAESNSAEILLVSPEYFPALRTPLLEGRNFAETDQRGAAPVLMVDRSTARRFWPGQSAVGKRIRVGAVPANSPLVTVIGVVADIRHDGIAVDGVPHLYLSIYQRSPKALGILVRAASDPSGLTAEVTRQIQAVDPNLPVFGVRTLDEMVDASLNQQRLSAQVMGVFAFCALLLAAIGVYGVLAYSVGQRTREIGIRMALGAPREEVVAMVLWQNARVILAGVAAGVLCSLALGQGLSRLLFGVSAHDPLVIGLVPLILLAVALAASYLPALRASRINPISALRCE